jgi:cytochrome c peroxidase
MNKIYFFLVAVSATLMSCEENIPLQNANEVPRLNTQYVYSKLELPVGISSNNNNFFSDVINTKEQNDIIAVKFPPVQPVQEVKITDDGARLGRVLFYDKKLSINNAISCGSCHDQRKAFSDGQATSLGFKGARTNRSSMAIINPIVQNNLFWDSRSQSILDLTLQPIQNHIEMGMEDLNYLEEKLYKTSYYRPLFKKAFGSETISKELIANAMSQFIGSITSANSRFDAELRLTSSTSSFTSLEKHGRNLFFGSKAKCSGCHSGANLSAPDGEFDEYGGGSSKGGENLRGTTNIGLDLISKDNGKKDGSFKIPSLRNIAVTAPYMHDGRFNTLEQVMDHYISGIKANANLDPKFKDSKGNPKGLDLSDYDKKAIIAFLNTLTDYKFLNDPKYSDPFKY